MVFGDGKLSKQKIGTCEKENFLIPVASIGGEIEIGESRMEDISESARGFPAEDDETGGNKRSFCVTEEYDIYGDLEGAVFSPAKKRLTTPQREALENELHTAQKEIKELKERVTVLSRENLNLQHNFASLLKTAKEDKEKNIFTLRELRNKLKHVTTMNAQKSSLPKEEVEAILQYCTQVETQLQSRISIQIVREALQAMKMEKIDEIKAKDFTRKWSKQLKLDNNMTIYLAKEQIPFGRRESVSFPKPNPKPVEKVLPEQVPAKSAPESCSKNPTITKPPILLPSSSSVPSSDITFANVLNVVSNPTSTVQPPESDPPGKLISADRSDRLSNGQPPSSTRRVSQTSEDHSHRRNSHDHSNRDNDRRRDNSKDRNRATRSHYNSRDRRRSRSPLHHRSRQRNRSRGKKSRSRSRSRSRDRTSRARREEKMHIPSTKLGRTRADK